MRLVALALAGLLLCVPAADGRKSKRKAKKDAVPRVPPSEDEAAAIVTPTQVVTILRNAEQAGWPDGVPPPPPVFDVKQATHNAIQAEKRKVGFFLSFCDFNRKMQKLPLFSCILIRNEGNNRQAKMGARSTAMSGLEMAKTIYSMSTPSQPRNTMCELAIILYTFTVISPLSLVTDESVTVNPMQSHQMTSPL